MRANFIPYAALLLLAIVPVSAGAQEGNPGSPRGAANSSAPTPRRANGKPDLNGIWSNRTTDGGDDLPGVIGKDGDLKVSFAGRLGGVYSAEIDGAVMAKGDRNVPMYKPEYWSKVRDMEAHSLQTDPQYKCQPWGVPRMGAPQQIVQQDDMLVFLYSGWPSITNTYRVIPMDRPHDADRVAQQNFRGDSVGRWDGDTLVVDTIGFNDESWLTSKLGYIHSTDLHVIERFTRQGSQIKYEVTVEDPQMLMQPWVWRPQMIKLNPDPKAMLPEDFPCDDRDARYTSVR